MKLSELTKGNKAEIIKINADKALRDRFSSFGVMRGEELLVKGCSLAKQTMEIEVGSTLIAVRADEAEKIEVERINT
ncbi:MAG TPA: ferrous iron transport protein A [Sulfurovum sp.]|nr:ferrous iron transport protein A [Sulfurovum sp.]